MKVTAIKTGKIRPFLPAQAGEGSLFSILDKNLKKMRENSVLAITSKIVSLCEGSFVKAGGGKERLIKSEADLYIPRKLSKYKIMFTIKNNILICSAGIDESNTGGYYVLWPKDPQKTANEVRKYLAKRFKLKKVGVIITDSRTTMMRKGTLGVALSHSGFASLTSYIGKPDIFGRKLKMTKSSIIDGLAASAVLIMGEGDEQTPLAIIEDVPFVKFQADNPSKKELKMLSIPLEDDLYAPMLKAVKWRKGKKR